MPAACRSPGSGGCPDGSEWAYVARSGRSARYATLAIAPAGPRSARHTALQLCCGDVDEDPVVGGIGEGMAVLDVRSASRRLPVDLTPSCKAATAPAEALPLEEAVLPRVVAWCRGHESSAPVLLYKMPTPLQTWSGKTAVCFLPVVGGLVVARGVGGSRGGRRDRTSSDRAARLRKLVLAPTGDLAAQVSIGDHTVTLARTSIFFFGDEDPKLCLLDYLHKLDPEIMTWVAVYTIATCPKSNHADHYLLLIYGGSSARNLSDQKCFLETKEPAAATSASGGTQVARVTCFKCVDSNNSEREYHNSMLATASASRGGRGGGHEDVRSREAVEEKECPCRTGSCLTRTSKSTSWEPSSRFYKCAMPSLRGWTMGGRFFALLLVIFLLKGTEAKLFDDICAVSGMNSSLTQTCPARQFQFKRPIRTYDNWINEQQVLQLISESETSAKSNNNHCPKARMNCKIGEIDVRRRWLLTSSSFSLFAAYFFMVFYLWWQQCRDIWKFVSTIISIAFNFGYMTFFWVKAHKFNLLSLICYLTCVIFVIVASYILGKFKVVADGILGIIFTAVAHILRMLGSGKTWNPKALTVAFCGIIGSTMFLHKLNWSTELCYKNRVYNFTIISCNVVVLLYYCWVEHRNKHDLARINNHQDAQVHSVDELRSVTSMQDEALNEDSKLPVENMELNLPLRRLLSHHVRCCSTSRTMTSRMPLHRRCLFRHLLPPCSLMRRWGVSLYLLCRVAPRLMACRTLGLPLPVAAATPAMAEPRPAVVVMLPSSPRGPQHSSGLAMNEDPTYPSMVGNATNWKQEYKEGGSTAALVVALPDDAGNPIGLQTEEILETASEESGTVGDPATACDVSLSDLDNTNEAVTGSNKATTDETQDGQVMHGASQRTPDLTSN
ncbi:hypothetical protein ACP70R_041141 [Stipagrostis hirtigluma subsp. patula]